MTSVKRRWLFKEQHTEDERRNMAKRIQRQQAGNIPVVIGRADRSRRGTTYQDLRVGAPGYMTIGEFKYVMRVRMEIRPEESMIFFIKNTIPPSTTTMFTLYREHKEEDLFLYVVCGEENAFGADA